MGNKVKLNVQNARLEKILVIAFLLTGYALFMFSDPTRTIISSSNFNQSFNVIFIFASIIFLFAAVMSRQILVKPAIFTLLFVGIALIDLIYSHSKYIHYLMVIATMILPFLLTAVNINETTFLRSFRKFLIVFNTVIFIVIGIGVVDYLTKASIQSFMSNYLFSEEMNKLVIIEYKTGIYRYYSILGMPLVNTWYVLLFFTLNYLYNRLAQPLVHFSIISVVTMIGLVICGSKTGLIAGVIMVILFNKIKKHKALYYISLFLVSTLIFFSPMFQHNLLQRYIIGANNGDFGGGRTKAVEAVIDGWVESPQWIYGGGIGYSRIVTKQLGGYINSFEYPVLMFMYDFSIVGTLLIYILIFFIPLYYLLKYKDYAAVVLFSLLFVYLNGFNILSNYSDYMGQLCLVILLFLHLSKIHRDRLVKS